MDVIPKIQAGARPLAEAAAAGASSGCDRTMWSASYHHPSHGIPDTPGDPTYFAWTRAILAAHGPSSAYQASFATHQISSSAYQISSSAFQISSSAYLVPLRPLRSHLRPLRSRFRLIRSHLRPRRSHFGG